MKNYNMFDVVELNNGNKATIITNDKSSIKVEEVNIITDMVKRKISA